MELWIRSQEKDKLVKVNSIEKQDHYSYKEVVENYMPPNATGYDSMKTRKVPKKDKYIKSVIMCNDEIYLGTYKTKERALEVLDEIQNILKPKKEPIEIHKLGAYQIKQILDMETQEMNTFVYEMPEE